MSDPMTNMGDAEDVLASIRRLVVDSHKAREQFSSSVNDGIAANGASSPPELLLLKTEDRIGDNDTAQAAIAPLVLGPELAISLVNAPEESADWSDEQDAETPAAQATSPEIVAAVEEWNPSFDDTPDSDAAAHVATLTLEERIAELESAIGSVEEEWEPDGSENLEAEIPSEVPRAFTEAHPVADVEAWDAGSNDDDSDDEIAVEAAVEFSDADAVGADHDLQEQDETPEFAPAGFDEAAEDEHEFEPAQEVQGEGDTSESLPTSAYVADDAEAAVSAPDAPTYLDEESMRELVADVLNEELRGQLGERMTRNIRRLVKREVARALAMRDLR